MAKDRFKTAPIERDEVIKDFSYESHIAPENPVRVMNMVVDKIIEANPEEFISEKKSINGAPAYPPSILYKLLLYGYFNRIPSSRRLEAECYRNIEVIWLVEGHKPDHWTINNFRATHGREIEIITRQFRRFLLHYGYITLDDTTGDGMKLKGNTKREIVTLKNLDKSLKNIDKKMEDYLSEMQRYDELETLEEEKLALEKEKLALEKEKLAMEKEKLALEKEKHAMEDEKLSIESSLEKLRQERLTVQKKMEALEEKKSTILS